MEYGNEVINKRTTAHSRISAIGGTREMMREAEFESLIGLLIDSGAVQRSTAARAITTLAEEFRAIALGERDTPYVTNSFDLFWRAHSLETLADKLRR